MWQLHYLYVQEIAQDRLREAALERLAHEAGGSAASRFAGLRRGGAIVAAGIARRLDECVAREEFGRLAVN